MKNHLSHVPEISAGPSNQNISPMASLINDGNVRIVSDGTTYSTKVLVAGVEVKHVAAVHILPMSANKAGAVHAVIEVIGPELDIVATLAHEEVITLKVDAEVIQAAMHGELLVIADQIAEKNPDLAEHLRAVVNKQKTRPE